MLCQTKYPEDYISRCENKLRLQLQAYTNESIEFETLLLNNLVLVLEMSFVHRGRGQEGKDGNPLQLNRAAFETLAAAYFEEIRRKFK